MAPYHLQFEREAKDLIQRLIKQADEHHVEVQMKIQMIYFNIRPASINPLWVTKGTSSNKNAAIEEQRVEAIVNASQSESTLNHIGEIQQSSTRHEGTDLKFSYSSILDGIETPEFNSGFKKSESNSLSACASEVIKSSNPTKIQRNKDSVRRNKDSVRPWQL